MKKYLYLLAAFLTFMIIGFSPPKVASASAEPPESAYHWDTDGEVEERFKTLVNQSYGKFNPKFEWGNPVMKVETRNSDESKTDDRTIYLDEVIDPNGNCYRLSKLGEEAKKKKLNGYFRYYFWLGDDGKATNGSHWSTLFFAATKDKVGDGNTWGSYSAVGGENVGRLHAVKSSGTFYQSSHTTGDRTMTMYIVDMKPWIEKYTKLDDFDETCYLQSVTKVWNDGKVSGECWTMLQWHIAAAGFTHNKFDEYSKHYNYKVNIKKVTPSNFTVHWKQWKTGDSKSDDKVDGLPNMEIDQEETKQNSGEKSKEPGKDPEKVNEETDNLFKSANTCLALSHLNSESYTNDGYYVKGIVLLSRAEKGGKIVSHKHYWITDSLSELGEVEDGTEVNHSYKGADSGADKDTFWTGSGGLAVQDDMVFRKIWKSMYKIRRMLQKYKQTGIKHASKSYIL